MADFIADNAKGKWAEKAADDPTKFGVLLLKTVEADSTLKTRATVAAILAANTEADFTNYARKTGLTATLTIDTTNHRVDLTISDQTWVDAGLSGTNNALKKLIIYYEDSASDSGRKFISAHDFLVTTNGANLATDFQGPQFARAA